MDIMVERGCGLDVHKETVVACIMGNGIKKESRTYSTMTEDLISLKEWLKKNKITHVAMESTGIYWKPVFNVLEDKFEVMIVNARHIKHVPGRKTDVGDSEWLCKLLRAGLVRGSFVPEKDIRDLRDLTRYKRKIINTISGEKNRVIKVLEDANIKISSVATDSFGVSGSAIIEELIKGGKSVEEMTKLVKGRLCKKKKEMKKALVGYMREHHKFMIKTSLEHIRDMEHLISEIDREIDRKMEKYQEEKELLKTIPGIKEEGAASIIAEIGTDMGRFPDEGHLSSWAGMSPGNNESAGKKKSGRVTYGNKNLRAMLVECAWAASRKNKTYLKAKYHSLVGRRGKKRALVAIGHKLLIMSYQILKNKVPYKELGIDYLDKRKKGKVIKSYVKRLQNLGYYVSLKEVPKVA